MMVSENHKILIVDDEPTIRRALQTTLSTLGFVVVNAARGEEALSLVRLTKFRAVLLDINMPGMGGIETCRRMRALSPRLSILMLTVRDREEDKVEALDAGADDFVTKPFHVGELNARLRAAVRRSIVLEKEERILIRIGEIELEPERRIVSKAGRMLQLTPKEFDLLYYLMSNAGLPLRHAKLLSTVWGSEYRNELEYLRTFVCQIRKKVEDDPTNPKYLLTEPYIGYRFSEASKSVPQAVQEID
jgi:two-component system, OmpR family, KDP operon response regulator KdpE